MLKIPKKASVNLTLVLSCLCLAVLGVLAGTVWNYQAIFFGKTLTENRHSVVFFSYLEIAAAVTAILLLLTLLCRIRRSEVFCDRNVASLRGISWLCYTETLFFLAEAVIYHTSDHGALVGYALFTVILTVIGLTFFFLGVILRVVKNILEEATALKRENDFTV